MSWNYRVFHTCYKSPYDDDITHYYSVRETYYHEDGSITAMSAEAARASGDTFTELMKDHALIQAAFSRTVLTPDDIPGYTYGSWEVSPAGVTL